VASVPSSLPSPSSMPPRRRRLGAASATGVVLFASAGLLAGLTGTAQAAPATAVPLGTAETFAVLAGTGITKTGATTIGGDVGTFPTTSISGPGTLVITGTNHGGDGVTAGAKDDLTTAYLQAESQALAQVATTDIGTADLAGQTLTPGVYASSSELNISGPQPLVLDGGGDPDAVFVFGAGSTLVTGSGTSVQLTGGATACNVFWQVTSSTTLGTNSSFVGTVLTLQSTTLTTGAAVQGAVLSRNGAVTLDTNTITRPACASPVSTIPVVVPPDVVTPPPVVTPPVTSPPVTPPPTTAPPTAIAGPAGPADRTTYGQVGRVPVGSVDTGDGSTS
jgi:hypothetical protein